MQLIFMGSPDFAVPSLERLADRHEVLAVYTQPPRPAGRGMAERPTPVAAAAKLRGLPVHWPISLRDPDVQARLAAARPAVIIVVAYGLLLPQAVLDLPPLGCINAHASLLPRWRGAAPIQRALEAGDDKTGICAMQMEAGLDTGPVLDCQQLQIPAGMTAGQLHDRLAEMAADCLEALLDRLQAGELLSVRPQPEDQVLYAAKISNAESELMLDQPAAILACKINAFDPVPGSWVRLAGGGRLKLAGPAFAQTARPDAKPLPPGHFIGLDGAGNMLISCGEASQLSIGQLQPPGKKPMSAKAFLNGRNWQPGQLIWARADATDRQDG
jgi:methionyl-tRNA formyltransferase